MRSLSAWNSDLGLGKVAPVLILSIQGLNFLEFYGRVTWVDLSRLVLTFFWVEMSILFPV